MFTILFVETLVSNACRCCSSAFWVFFFFVLFNVPLPTTSGVASEWRSVLKLEHENGNSKVVCLLPFSKRRVFIGFFKKYIHEVWLLKNGICFKNIVYLKKLTIQLWSLSIYSPPLSTHRCIRVFHYSKQCCKSSDARPLSWSAVFVFTSSNVWSRVPCKAVFSFGNR